MTVLMGLATRLRLAKLQLITDIRSAQGDWAAFVAKAFDGGVDLLQVRDEAASDKELADALDVARTIAFNRGRGIVVSGPTPVAASFGADFLHLGAAAGGVAGAREGLPQASLVGRSVHTVDELRAALADPDVAYLFVGPVYAATSGGAAAPGLDLVRAAAAAAPATDPQAKPWFAVGGITAQTLQQVLDAGALRVAVSGAVTRASDPEAAAGAIATALQQAWDARPEMERYVLGAFSHQPQPGTPAADPIVPVQDDAGTTTPGSSGVAPHPRG